MLRAGLLLPLLGVAAATAEEWQPLRDAIDVFADVPDTYVQLGDASGPRFAYQKGSTGPGTSMPVASATKWLGNVALFVLVEEGSLSLDDRVHQHVGWWTSDPNDPRSRITLRHCMAFTTGYVGQVSCAGLSSTEECARRVYEDGTHVHAPGTFFDYNSDHSRIAAAMAVGATAEPMMALIERTVFERTAPPMTETFFADPAAPDLASTMTTTPRDYEAFLSSYWRGELVTPQGRRVMESDQCPACEACEFCQTRGHYALGNWAGCLGWGAEGGEGREGHWPSRCAVAEEWWSSGAFGYWPQTVRPTTANGGLDYYFHLAMQGPGSDTAGVMKTAIQPVMEAILRGEIDAAHTLAARVKQQYSARNSNGFLLPRGGAEGEPGDGMVTAGAADGGLFGQWGTDAAGLPLFNFTCDQTTSPFVGDYARTCKDSALPVGNGPFAEDPTASMFHIGNDELVLLLSTHGYAQVRQDEGGAKLLNDFSPADSQFGGGLGYLVEQSTGKLLLSSFYAAVSDYGFQFYLYWNLHTYIQSMACRTRTPRSSTLRVSSGLATLRAGCAMAPGCRWSSG